MRIRLSQGSAHVRGQVPGHCNMLEIATAGDMLLNTGACCGVCPQLVTILTYTRRGSWARGGFLPLLR